MKEHKRIWWGLLCVVGFVLNFSAFYPGFLSPDGIDQYQQSISHHYTDWHPPIMAVLWSILNKVYNGPASMLFLQLALLWGSCYLLMTTADKGRWHISIVLLALSPFVQNFSGYIIKDSQMAFSWLLAFAIMFRAGYRDQKLSVTEIIACCILMLYGAMVRINALPGVIPLCCILVWLVLKNQALKIKGLAVIILFLLFCLAQYSVNEIIIRPEPQHPEDKLYMHDLTGIFVKTGKNVFPAEVYQIPGFDTSYLRAHYVTATFDNIWGNTDDVHVQVSDTDEPITQQLHAAWMMALRKYPLIYFENRFDGFLYYLQLKTRPVRMHYLYRSMEPNLYGFVYNPNILSKLFTVYIVQQEKMPYMRPWFWLLLNLALLFFVKRVRNDFVKLCYAMLLFSSLLYLLPCFFIFPIDTDFRYFYWNCIACSLVICLLVLNRDLRITGHKKSVN